MKKLFILSAFMFLFMSCSDIYITSKTVVNKKEIYHPESTYYTTIMAGKVPVECPHIRPAYTEYRLFIEYDYYKVDDSKLQGNTDIRTADVDETTYNFFKINDVLDLSEQEQNDNAEFLKKNPDVAGILTNIQ